MTTITANQRTINIINKALEIGFTFEGWMRMEEIRIDAEEYLTDNTEAIEEECEVISLGNHGQRVDWSDDYGYEYWCQGEIVTFDSHKPENYKFFHSTVINSLGQVINLFTYNK
jgi:hypothetical protein